MISIREIAPTLWAVQCPTRGTFSTAYPSRRLARAGIWTAIKSPPERWLDASQLRASLTTLGFIACPSAAPEGLDL